MNLCLIGITAVFASSICLLYCCYSVLLLYFAVFNSKVVIHKGKHAQMPLAAEPPLFAVSGRQG